MNVGTCRDEKHVPRTGGRSLCECTSVSWWRWRRELVAEERQGVVQALQADTAGVGEKLGSMEGREREEKC